MRKITEKFLGFLFLFFLSATVVSADYCSDALSSQMSQIPANATKVYPGNNVDQMVRNCANSGGALSFQPGTYTITTSTPIPSNCSLYSNGATLIQPNGNRNTTQNIFTIQANTQNVKVIGFNFRGTGIRLEGAGDARPRNIVISHNQFQDAREGIEGQRGGINGGEIECNYFDNFGYNVVILGSHGNGVTGAGIVNDLKLNYNEFNNIFQAIHLFCGFTGLSDNIEVNDNTIIGNIRHAIEIQQDCDYLDVMRNRIGLWNETNWDNPNGTCHGIAHMALSVPVGKSNSIGTWESGGEHVRVNDNLIEGDSHPYGENFCYAAIEIMGDDFEVTGNTISGWPNNGFLKWDTYTRNARIFGNRFCGVTGANASYGTVEPNTCLDPNTWLDTPPPTPSTSPSPTTVASPSPAASPGVQSAYADLTIPGIIQTELYDNGGEGTAYHDLDTANQGAQYFTDSRIRPNEGVDMFSKIINGQDIIGVGWTQAGEWLEYTTTIAYPGEYRVKVRSAHNNSTSIPILRVKSPTDQVDIQLPNTGNWDVFQTTTASQTLFFDQGEQILRLEMVNDGGDVDSIEFEFTGDVPPDNCPADVNQDGIVDGTDYAIVGGDFLSATPLNSRSDINQDGVVDNVDYALMGNQFLQSCN